MHKLSVVQAFVIVWIMSVGSAEENATTFVDTYSEASRNSTTTDPTYSNKSTDSLPKGQRNEIRSRKNCTTYYKIFRRHWISASLKLQRYLTTMKKWNCPEFQKECERRFFAVTTYTKMVYKRLCNFPHFVDECSSKFREYGLPSNASQSSDYTEDVGNLIIKSFRDKENGLTTLSEPCIQSLLEEARYNNLSFYYKEAKFEQVSFCGVVWNSLPTSAYKRFNVPKSFLIGSRCRTNLLIYLVFLVVLSVIVVIGNTLVIIVLYKLKKNANSQWVFKMSIAVADLLAGVLALPGLVVVVAHYFFLPFGVTDNWKLIYPRLPREFIGALGFTIFLSLTVSLYSLSLASFDRFMVVFRPLKYEKFRALRLSKLSVLLLWVLSALFAAVPFMVPSFAYQLHGVIVTSQGDAAYAVYGIMLGIPLLVMWALNVGTYCYYRFNARKTSFGIKEDVESDRRLLKTLSAMVGAFTICLLSLIGIMVWTASSFGHGGFGFKTDSTSSALEAIGLYILMSNSMWNFIIYNVRSLEFRSTVSNVFSDMKKKIDEGLRRSSTRKASTGSGGRTSSYWFGSNRSSSAE